MNTFMGVKSDVNHACHLLQSPDLIPPERTCEVLELLFWQHSIFLKTANEGAPISSVGRAGTPRTEPLSSLQWPGV